LDDPEHLEYPATVHALELPVVDVDVVVEVEVAGEEVDDVDVADAVDVVAVAEVVETVGWHPTCTLKENSLIKLQAPKVM